MEITNRPPHRRKLTNAMEMLIPLLMASIIDDGVNGYICKQNDTKDLIMQIEKFLELPREARKQMGLAGRAKGEKEFNRQIVIDKYLAELK